MSLTGTPFFVVLVIATVLAVLATLLLWGRVRGPHPLRWLARILLIGLCQLTAICVVAVAINNSYGLYASWDDLLGTEQDAIAMPGPPVARAKFNDGPNGIKDTYFRGAKSQMSGQVMVWTPPQYDDPAYRKTKFPVVMLLHGVPGSPQSWLEQGGLPGDLQQLVDGNAAHPFILAMPVVNPGSVDTDCSDTPHRKTATWLATDVTDLISHHFRTAPGPKNWGLLGFSTGGYCAAKLPLQYPKTFGAGVAFDPDPLTGDPDVLTDPALRQRNSPQWLVRHAKADVGLFLATSAQDPISPPANIERLKKAAEGTRTRVKTLVLPTGGHNYGTWTRMYPAAFGWLSQELRAPEPSA
ncbi:alpha/beta hydrolase [Streptomyces chrestomyceticus]|uniref:alpha/beta hydrolase n=1 Tax=Streptomyces chrestomyceticus TaxID=68185 RepID=UPI0035A952FC